MHLVGDGNHLLNHGRFLADFCGFSPLRPGLATLTYSTDCRFQLHLGSNPAIALVASTRNRNDGKNQYARRPAALDRLRIDSFAGGQALGKPFNFVQAAILKALTEALFHDVDMAIP